MTITTSVRRSTRPRRLVVVVSVAALAVVPGASSALAGNENPGDNVTICHATSSDSNPYVVNSPNKNGNVSGHADHTGPVWNPSLKAAHTDWGDIIPPFDYNEQDQVKHFAGLNWDANGQAWYENSCVVPITATVDKTNDANADATFSDDETTTAEGTDVPFSVTITNTSVVPAVVTGLLDTVADSPVGFTPSPDPVGTTLAAGASTTFTFTVTGYSPADGLATVNLMTVTLADADNPENDATASDTSTVRTVVPEPDVAVVKTGTATAAPGDTLTWTLTASNSGVVPASGVTLTDTLPAEVTFVSATGDGWTCVGTTTVVCTYGSDLAVGASSAVTLVGTLDAAFTGTSVSNTVVVTPDDATPADNTSTFVTVVTQPGGGGGGGGGTVTPPQDFTGGGGGTTLPRTGSPLLWLLATGLALVLTGTGFVLLSPVRREELHR